MTGSDPYPTRLADFGRDNFSAIAPPGVSPQILRDNGGSVSIIGVFTLVAMIGMAALAIDLGRGYQTKVGNQGAADAAALAAANAYTSNPSDALLTATAQDVARANGIAVSNVTVTHLTNYSATVSDAVQVVIRTTVPVYFSRIFSSSSGYVVNVASIASLATASVSPCIIALSPTAGVTLSGGAVLAAPNCAVNTNAAINVSGGSSIVAQATNSAADTSVSGGSSIIATGNVIYGTSLNIAPGSLVSPRQVKKSNSVADPYATNAALAAAFGKLGSFTAPNPPSVPAGSDLTLGYYPTTMTFGSLTGILVGNIWTFPAGTYNIRNLNTQSLILDILGPSTVTVSASVNVGGGGGILLGTGPVTINAPVNLSGGTSLVIGAGRHYLGQLTVGGGATAIIAAGDLDVNGAILVSGGGSKVTIAAGNYAIGNNGAGTAINLSGGSILSFGDGTFSANGAIYTSGGSTLVFGATANHLINGDLNLNGNSTFGAGSYIINGNFTNNTGGAMLGLNVSFVLAGTLNAAGGTSINLAAPTTGSPIGIPDILFATKSAAATTLGGGTQDVFSGVIYVPNSDFSMSGGASATGVCFSLVAKTVTLASGPSAAIACPSLAGSSGGGNVNLIQ